MTDRLYETVDLDATHGTLVTTTLNDVTNSTSSLTQSDLYPANLSLAQELHARMLLVGYDDGHLAVSFNHGASWGTTLFPSPVRALCAVDHAASDYPLGYAGLDSGALYSIALPQNTTATYATTLVATLSAGVTALSLAPTSRGSAWIGCADGSLYVYSPDLAAATKVAQLSAPILSLAHLGDSQVCYGICNDAAAGLFEVVAQAVGSIVTSLDLSQTYTGLSSACRGALLATGASSVKWSPDAAISLGTIAGLPLAGPYSAPALHPLDPNEWTLYAAAGTQAQLLSLGNGATITQNTALIRPILMLYDPAQPGCGYALAVQTGGTHEVLCLSYDGLSTWAQVLPAGIDVTRYNATSLALGPLTMQ